VTRYAVWRVFTRLLPHHPVAQVSDALPLRDRARPVKLHRRILDHAEPSRDIVAPVVTLLIVPLLVFGVPAVNMSNSAPADPVVQP
jgi:hypothetical protein